MAKPVSIEVWNPNGKYRVVSTKPMPGTRWINLLIEQDCRVEVVTLFHFFSLFLFIYWILHVNFDQILFFFFFQISDMHPEENYTLCWRYHCFDWWQVRWSHWTGILFSTIKQFFFLMNSQKSYFGLLKFVIWVLSFSWQRTGERLCLLHWVEQEERLLVTWLLVTTMLTLMLLTNMVLLLETLL